MAAKKIAFATTYRGAYPDSPSKQQDPYECKKPIKRSNARWLSLSTMSCRDFSKDRYDYKDLNFQTSDSGIVYNLPKTLQKLQKPEGKFYSTELRFVNFKPNSKFNSHKNVKLSNTVSSQGSFYGSSLYSSDVNASYKAVQKSTSIQASRTGGRLNDSRDQSLRRKDSASQTLRRAKCQTDSEEKKTYSVETCKVRNSETQTETEKHVNFEGNAGNMDVKYRPRSASVLKSSIKSKPTAAKPVVNSAVYYSASKDIAIQAFDEFQRPQDRETNLICSTPKLRESSGI